jgi:hypothetical protein
MEAMLIQQSSRVWHCKRLCNVNQRLLLHRPPAVDVRHDLRVVVARSCGICEVAAAKCGAGKARESGSQSSA